MKSRFSGSHDAERRLIDALSRQQVIAGDQSIAAQVARVGSLQEYLAGQFIITQGGLDNDIYFILDGCVSILVNEREVAQRAAGQHIGEIALLDPTKRRTASVVCVADVTVLRVSEGEFTKVADSAPRVWRNIAIELSTRLDQRRRFHSPPNRVPKVFIGSSSEGLKIAEAIQSGLPQELLVSHIWTQDVFTPSSTTIEALEKMAAISDFAILTLSPDDVVKVRASEHSIPRDNVVFELGLFMGALGRDRTFMATPKGSQVKLPSDMLGVTAFRYECSEKDGAIIVSDLCAQMTRIVKESGSK